MLPPIENLSSCELQTTDHGTLESILAVCQRTCRVAVPVQRGERPAAITVVQRGVFRYPWAHSTGGAQHHERR